MAYRKVHSFAAVGALGLCLAWASPVACADLTIIPQVGGAPNASGSVFVSFDTELNGSATTNGGMNGGLVPPATARCMALAGNTLTVTFNPLSGTVAVGATRDPQGPMPRRFCPAATGTGSVLVVACRLTERTRRPTSPPARVRSQ